MNAFCIQQHSSRFNLVAVALLRIQRCCSSMTLALKSRTLSGDGCPFFSVAKTDWRRTGAIHEFNLVYGVHPSSLISTSYLP